MCRSVAPHLEVELDQQQKARFGKKVFSAQLLAPLSSALTTNKVLQSRCIVNSMRAYDGIDTMLTHDHIFPFVDSVDGNSWHTNIWCSRWDLTNTVAIQRIQCQNRSRDGT